MQTRHGVLGGASWTRGKVSKARMRLVRSRCQQIRASKLEHAVWQDGDDVLLSHRSRTSLGASIPRKVDGTRQSDLWWVPAGFSQGPVCESRPGPYTRLGQIWVLDSACWVHGRGGTAGQTTVHKADRRPTKQFLSKQIADS